jgi:D-serine deaminase-like pyridoxal phosphate-dependent protein
VIRSIAIASGLGVTSAYSWLKIPVAEEMERVAESFTLPVLDRLPTPCLVVDAAAATRNIQRCAAFFSGHPAALRPHFKAHKCTTLMRQQLAAGGCSGVACQTSWEALVLARAGFPDILIANQVVDAAALGELAQAAAIARLTVAVDDAAQVDLLATVARGRGVSLGVLIELDVGAGRCGLPFGDASLVPLAERIARQDRLSFRGLQAYEGHAVHRDSREVRATLVRQAAHQVRHEQARLTAAGFDCEIISGGGTGTYDLAAQAGALTEIQAGSYVLMDGRYGTLDLPFEPALYCVTTVISRRGSRAVLNAGLKELTVEYGMPAIQAPGARITALSDEHAQVRLAPGPGDLAVGDKVLVIPAHVDPAVNLYDRLFAWDGDTVTEWEVDGRRRYRLTGD